MWTCRRLAVTAETADERVRVGVAGVAEAGGEVAVVTAEVEAPGPVPARGFTVPDTLNVYACLVSVIIPSEREVIGDGREDVVFAYLAPAIEPVDIRHRRLR